MATLQEQILARLVAALTGTPGVASVGRSRKVGVDRDETPALIVRPEPTQDERMGQLADKHLFDALVIVHVRADPWDQAADPIVDAVHKTVMTDAQIKAIATDVRRVSCEPEDLEADATAGQYSLRYRFTYLTRADNLSAQP